MNVEYAQIQIENYIFSSNFQFGSIQIKNMYFDLIFVIYYIHLHIQDNYLSSISPSVMYCEGMNCVSFQILFLLYY